MVFFANLIWFLSNLPEYIRFVSSAKKIEKEQEELLKKYITENRDTKYGLAHRFSRLVTIEEFQKNVPFSTYEDYEIYVEKIKNKERSVLTNDEVLLLEPTGGSVSSSKYIPYTYSLKKEFQRGIAVWMVDMFIHEPKLFFSRSYWLITPNTGDGNKTIGFEDDSEYLGPLGRTLMSVLLVMPNEVSKITDRRSFFYVTTLFLLKYKDLGFISVWSPTILSLIFENFFDDIDLLLKDLAEGKINQNILMEDNIRIKLERRLGKNPKRTKEIKRIIAEDYNNIYEKIWPKMKIISCWADGNSRNYLKDINKYFPHTRIQEKGLLSTEALVSFPFGPGNKKILSFRSHFFEFVKKNKEKVFLTHELSEGKEYVVVVTTGGGLYRYKTGDIVKVTGFYKKTPFLEFLGKEDNISDLFGEKVHEGFIGNILKDLFDSEPLFFMIAPEKYEGGEVNYTLFIETTRNICQTLIKDLDKRLCDNFHYKHCRNTGQLGKAKIFLIKKGGLKTYTERCLARGQKIGSIKHKILDTSFGWTKYFEGDTI